MGCAIHPAPRVGDAGGSACPCRLLSVIAAPARQNVEGPPGRGSARAFGWLLSRGRGPDGRAAGPREQLAAAVGAAVAQLAGAGGAEGALVAADPGVTVVG